MWNETIGVTVFEINKSVITLMFFSSLLYIQMKEGMRSHTTDLFIYIVIGWQLLSWSVCVGLSYTGTQKLLLFLVTRSSSEGVELLSVS